MPIYEYQCQSCRSRFERIQKFSDPPVESCPACQGPVQKLVSSPAFQFKGTGWYVTDYARKSEPETTGDQAAKSSDKADKTEAAPAAEGTQATGASAAEKPARPAAPATGDKSSSQAPCARASADAE